MRVARKLYDRFGRVSSTAILAVAFAAVVLAGPAYAHSGLAGAGPAQQEDDVPACLEDETDDVEGELADMVGETIDSLPDVARDAMVGERISITIDTHKYGVVVDEEGKITSVTTGELSDPTLKSTTDCETVKGIINSESRNDAFRQAISRGDISWEGVGGAKNVQIAFGSKAVQVYEIVNADDSTGDADDATEGFQKGITDTVSWPAEALD